MEMTKAAGSLDPVAISPNSFAEYRQLWKQAESLSLLTEHPLHLDIELTSVCNLRCEMCWQSGLLDAPMGFMKDDLFKKIVDEGVAMGMRAIKLQVRGESTMHPRLAELARYAKNAGVFDIQLTTNGTLLDDVEKLDSLLASGLHKLIFSVDPAHDKSADEIYGDKAPDVRSIVLQTLERRAALGFTEPLVRVQAFTEPGQTQDSLLAQLKLDYPGADEYISTHIFEAKDDEDAVGGLSTWYDFLPCSYLWTRLAVYWNGDATICCRDYNCTMKLGNVNETSVRDLWLGREMMRIRTAHLNDERQQISLCAHCEVCTKHKEGNEESNKFLHLTSVGV